ncbi:SDR family oxidoreductase [Actinomycetaceae bacterium WB03_NA08]|uniref:SDR family oxidoreductase n=1 Tax=Scrofimicrobium canadense TaxID=2652290 RepID=A0A6N7W751_9ACTO|nr:glucose 1-dehydrogenase [Scrofimicrobium canadense]MSS85075.1 SDR family oxidoreductase [Scrofimicrobium canadense]
MMQWDFDGRVALVTGAGSGLGEAISRDLAENGARVVVADISKDAAERVAEEIAESGGLAFPVVGDTSSKHDSKAMVDIAISTYGQLNYAVNNAGIGGPQAPVGDTDLDAWDRVIDINLNGVLYGMRYQIPAMIDTGATTSTIVNMASIHGMVAALGNGAYTAAKHGVVGITRTAAGEYGPQGLRVNAVGPGYIETPLLANLPREAYDALASKHLLGKLGKAEEVAHLVTYLLSDYSSFITGAYIVIDGGYTAI